LRAVVFVEALSPVLELLTRLTGLFLRFPEDFSELRPANPGEDSEGGVRPRIQLTNKTSE
jgi:hypothetical protein